MGESPEARRRRFAPAAPPSPRAAPAGASRSAPRAPLRTRAPPASAPRRRAAAGRRQPPLRRPSSLVVVIPLAEVGARARGCLRCGQNVAPARGRRPAVHHTYVAEAVGRDGSGLLAVPELRKQAIHTRIIRIFGSQSRVQVAMSSRSDGPKTQYLDPKWELPR